MSNAFTTSKKGELFELKAELNSESKSTRKEAVRKTILAMTAGRDVSSLFTDVLNCMQTNNIEIKKLVYLYVVNYAQTKPDLAILAVNMFVRDAADPSPLLRALALRTMSCIRVDKILEYLIDPLQIAVHDENPYVRKTAALCIAKLHAMNPDMVTDQGLLEKLMNMLGDGNPMVVTNTVAALRDISDTRPGVITLDSQLVARLLHALNDCNEWGQIYILDALVDYDTQSVEEADSMVERVTARLQHANGAVVLSAVKLIVNMADKMSNYEKSHAALQKAVAPLITLLSTRSEMQFVVLRSIRIINQKWPGLFGKELRSFYCKYNDPLCVKFEKLELMMALLDGSNVSYILAELRDYALEVDPDFVKRSIGCISRIAMELENVADQCVDMLMTLLKGGHGGPIQDSVVALRDVMRCYGSRYERHAPTICDTEGLDQPEARAAQIWILGECSQAVPNAVELLESNLDSFLEEPLPVQTQLLTACVKTYLHRGGEAQSLVENVIRLSTQECYTIDLRDRGYAYSRLLACGHDVARKVVLVDKPSIVDNRKRFDPDLLEDLCANVGKVSSVLLKDSGQVRPPKMALLPPSGGGGGDGGEDLLLIDDQPAMGSTGQGDPLGALPAPTKSASLLDELFGPAPAGNTTPALPAAEELLALPSSTAPASQGSAAVGQGSPDDLLAALSLGNGSVAVQQQQPVAVQQQHPASADTSGRQTMLSAAQDKGLEVAGSLVTVDDRLFLELVISNKQQHNLDGFGIQFNKSAFGLKAAAPLAVQEPLRPGSSDTAMLELSSDGPVDASKGISLQMAIKCNPGGVSYMVYKVGSDLDVLLSPGGKVARNEFLSAWSAISNDLELTKSPVHLAAFGSVETELFSRLERSHIFLVAKLSARNASVPTAYFSAKTLGSNMVFLIEMTYGSATTATLAVRQVGERSLEVQKAMLSTLERLLAAP